MLVVVFALSGVALAENKAFINQSGKNQDAEITQFGHAANALVVQKENGNQADVKQGNLDEANYFRGAHESFVYQEGRENDASVIQENKYNGTFAAIWQEGTKNEASILQHGHQSNARALIMQDGEANSAKQDQTAYTTVADLLAVAFQQGKKNTIVQQQTHPNPGKDKYVGDFKLFAFQNGNNNEITQTQKEKLGDRLGWAVQEGDGNIATMTQGYGGELKAFVYQDGNKNVSTQKQVAGTQLGSVWQVGNKNDASITQLNGMNSGVISQYGNNNTALISQTGF